jgi:hypothetical protein
LHSARGAVLSGPRDDDEKPIGDVLLAKLERRVDQPLTPVRLANPNFVCLIEISAQIAQRDSEEVKSRGIQPVLKRPRVLSARISCRPEDHDAGLGSRRCGHVRHSGRRGT